MIDRMLLQKQMILVETHSPGLTSEAKRQIASRTLENETSIWHEIAVFCGRKCFCAQCDTKKMKLVNARKDKHEGFVTYL